MKPTIKNNSYVLSIPFFTSKNKKQMLIFNHNKYGCLIKRFSHIDEMGFFWFKGENISSLTSSEIGPIKKGDILGRVLISFCK